MNKFNFYQDEKVSIWQRNYFQIKANSYEEALEIVKKLKDEAITYHDDDETIIFQSCESLYDTSESLIPIYNGGYPTLEIYNDKHEEIANNSE